MAFLAPLGALFTGGGLGTALQVGAGVVSTLGAVGAANYQAQVAKNNAQIAEQNAAQASQQSQQEQLESDQQVAALIGEQEAIQGASGLSIGGASQLRTRRTAQRLGRQDAQRIRDAGVVNIQSFQQQAENFRGEARVQRSNAIGSALGGVFGTLGSVQKSLVGGAKSTRNANRLKIGVRV